MKRPVQLFHSIPVWALSCLLIFASCAKGEQGPVQDKKIQLTFESHKTGDTVKRPLPVIMHGRISSMKELQEPGKAAGLFVYLIEQGTREKIWHIEPMAVIDDKGTWKGLTWLGNRITGNRSRYNVCVFASRKELKLNDGNHPVKEKPENTGEACIELIRKD